MKFRKKPVVIEAVQWTGHNLGAVLVLWDEGSVPGELAVDASFLSDGPPKLAIPTLEGEMTASPGDWIIRGVAGEVYPCKPDIFEATYEAVE